MNVTISDPNSHVLDVRTEHPVLWSFLHCVMFIQLRPQTTVEASCPSISLLREKVCGWSSTVAWPFGVLYAEYLMTTYIFFTLDTNETSLVLVQYALWNQTERCSPKLTPTPPGLTGQAKAAAFRECLSEDSWGQFTRKMEQKVNGCCPFPSQSLDFVLWSLCQV